jgi:hypothetical protein
VQSATALTTSAWVLYRGDAAAEEIAPLSLNTVELPAPGPRDVLVEPLYGSWEGNMDHAVQRSPVDVCGLRGENRVVLGNAGVVRVLEVGSAVTRIAPNDFGIVFCNGVADKYGYPVTIFGYDTPGTIGVLAAKTILRESQIIPIPPSSPLSMEQWAAFSLRYITAWANWRVAWGCFRAQMPDVDPGDVYVWQRERAMKRFKSVRHAQRFLSAFSGISAHFRPRRHRLSATGWRTEMAERFAVWNQVTALETAA